MTTTSTTSSNTEAFVYCWSDHKTGKLYIGVHKGDEGDGYVCSSKVVNREYKSRPNDFSRTVVARGSWDMMSHLETQLLETFDAATNEFFYNQHNNRCSNHIATSVWKGQKHSEESKQKMSESQQKWRCFHSERMKLKNPVQSQKVREKIRAKQIANSRRSNGHSN